MILAAMSINHFNGVLLGCVKGTAILTIILRSLGAKIGKRCVINAIECNQRSNVTVGDDVVINPGALLYEQYH